MKEVNMVCFTTKTDREPTQVNLAIDRDLIERIDKVHNTLKLCLDNYISKGAVVSDLIRLGLNAQDTIMIDSCLYSYSDFEKGYNRIHKKVLDLLEDKLDCANKVAGIVRTLNIDINKITDEDYEKIKTYLLSKELAEDSELRIINLKYIDAIVPVKDYIFKIFESYKKK